MPLHDVLDGGALHEERVLPTGLLDSLDALRVGVREHVGVGVHEVPHRVENAILCTLEQQSR